MAAVPLSPLPPGPSQLPACYGRRPLIRGSDDFYPRDKGSHGPHIYANAFNGLMISCCGLQVRE